MRFAALIGILILVSPAKQVAAVDGAVIVYGLHTPSEDGFKRILTEESVKYVCTQQIFSKAGVPPLARERAKELSKAGKRIVLQIWWGPGGDFPWSKYSFANIALDEVIRKDFFRDVVDPCIEQYGAENLYGVHLLEESGMQFGTDVGRREDPDNFSDFEEPGNSYASPFWSGAGDLPGGWKMANVRRHERDFTRMTGLRFADAEKWGLLEHHLFNRWVSVRLQSGGQVEFAKHIHRTYPGLKAFTWDILLTGGEHPRTDYHLEAQHFDGVICDIYQSPNFNYKYQRAYRLLCPKAEIIHFAMGGMGVEQGYPYASPDTKRALTTGAYLAGVDVVGFFEHPGDFERPEAWETNVDLFRRLQPVPRFESKPSVLLLANSVSNIFSSTWAWTGLKSFDFLPTWEAHTVDLQQYQAVILHVDGPVTDSVVFWNADALREKYGLPGHIDYRALDQFVERGGLLILSGQTRLEADCPLFVAREGMFRTPAGGGIPTHPLVVAPEGWLKDAAGLKREYRFSTLSIPVEADAKRVASTDGGHFLRHGKGAVALLPYNRFYDPKEKYESKEWLEYRQFLTDLAHGLLEHMGKGEVARECLAEPAAGNSYLEGTSQDGRYTAAVLFSPSPPPVERIFPSSDVLTGRPSAVLSKESTAVLTKNE